MKKLFIAAVLVLLPVAVWAIDFTPTGAVLTVTYTEPSTNTDGSVLNDLAKTTINSRVCPVVGSCSAAYEQLDVPAASASGGGAISKAVTVAIAPGQENNVEVFATATDFSGNISPESIHVVKRVDRLSPSAPK